MRARDLLIGRGGGGAFMPAVPSTVTLAAAPNGAMNPWNVPGAVTVGSKVWVSYVDGSGNLEIITYDGSSVGGPYTLHAAFEIDAHTGPALCRRASDGKWLAVYTKHNNTPINLKVSTNADDPSAWGVAASLDAQLGGTRYTDVQLHQLSNGTLFLFYRDEPSAGTDSRWCYSTSTDGGTTWAAQTILYRIASNRSYVITWKAPGSDLIHFVATNDSGGGFTKLGHFRMDGITLARTKSDGTTISSALPLVFADLTQAYSGTSGVFPLNIAFTAEGYPVVATRDDGTLNNIYTRWNGSAWSSVILGSCGTGYEYNGAGLGFGEWGHAIDDGNPDVVWALRDTGGRPELWRYWTDDAGATFTGFQVTTGASADQQQVICVRNPPTWLRAVWQIGPWTDYNHSLNVGVRGVSA